VKTILTQGVAKTGNPSLTLHELIYYGEVLSFMAFITDICVIKQEHASLTMAILDLHSYLGSIFRTFAKENLQRDLTANQKCNGGIIIFYK
jgi:hypothetical protein